MNLLTFQFIEPLETRNQKTQLENDFNLFRDGKG